LSSCSSSNGKILGIDSWIPIDHIYGATKLLTPAASNRITPAPLAVDEMCAKKIARQGDPLLIHQIHIRHLESGNRDHPVVTLLRVANTICLPHPHESFLIRGVFVSLKMDHRARLKKGYRQRWTRRLYLWMVEILVGRIEYEQVMIPIERAIGCLKRSTSSDETLIRDRPGWTLRIVVIIGGLSRATRTWKH
jgi:hypothetical protein